MTALPRLHRAALAALLSLPFAPAFARQSQRPAHRQLLVEEVAVAGNRRLAREEIFRHIKTRPGDPYDERQMMRDFQTLLDLGFFDRRQSHVVTETGVRGGVVIIFELGELPLIESVSFEGLRRAEERAVRSLLRARSMGVESGGVYEPEKIRRAMSAITEVLRGRGWRRVEVETRRETRASNSVRLTFVVGGEPPYKPPGRLDKFKKPDAVAARPARGLGLRV
jgi:outer membrane protein assembly factor BamA